MGLFKLAIFKYRQLGDYIRGLIILFQGNNTTILPKFINF